MRVRAVCLLALVVLAAVVVSASDSEGLPPCKKAEKAKLLSIEQRYPTLVKDYHPVDDAIDPNMIKDKDADRTARVIIREHLEWERENPEPPKQLSSEELKELNLQVAQQTIDIQKEHKQFKALSKFVDDDHVAYQAAEVAAKKKAEEAAKAKAKDAVEKAKSQALLKQVEAARAINAKKAAAGEAARAAAHAKQDKKNGVKPKLAATPASAAASPKINALKVKVQAGAPVVKQAKTAVATQSPLAAAKRK